jgi:hypothetical protein
MDRRELLAGLAVTAAGLTAVAGASEACAAQGGTDDLHDRCAKNCAETMIACNKGFHHCHRQLADGKKLCLEFPGRRSSARRCRARLRRA